MKPISSLGLSIALLITMGAIAEAQDYPAPMTVNGDPGGAESFRVNGAARIRQVIGTNTANHLQSAFLASSNVPSFAWKEEDQAVDRRVWDAVIDGGQFSFRSLNDANTIGHWWMTVYRSAGVAIQRVAFQESGGSVTVGGDPGGPELLRVGGDARVSGIVNSGLGAIVDGRAPTYPAFIAGTRGMPASSYSFVLRGDNDQGMRLVAFVNGSARSADGGVNAATIRNDGGDFNVGGIAGKLSLLGTSTIVGADPGGTELLRVGGSVRMNGSITIQQGGSYDAGSIYSDVNWGMLIRARQQSPVIAEFAWANSQNVERMRITPTGNVGIGVANPTSKLAVNGTISASEVKVTANPADYVFEEGYTLRPLSEVETHIKAEKHLPGIPSAKAQRDDGGTALSEMQRLHLEKIEELTLYAIQAEKHQRQMAGDLSGIKKDLSDAQGLLAKAQEENEALRVANEKLEERLDRIEKAMAEKNENSR